VIFRYLQGIHLKIVFLGNLLKCISYSVLNISAENPFSDISEPTPNDTSYHIPHDWFFSIPCGKYGTFIPAFGRRAFHPVYKTGYSSSEFP